MPTTPSKSSSTDSDEALPRMVDDDMFCRIMFDVSSALIGADSPHEYLFDCFFKGNIPSSNCDVENVMSPL